MSFGKRIVAHRGAWKKNSLPQNSLAAFREAQSLNIGGIELDLQFTKDKQILVFHDDQILGKPISQTLFSEIQDFQLSNGENIPLFEVFLNHWDTSKELWIELKAGILDTEQKRYFVKQVLLELRNYSAKTYYFISFDSLLLDLILVESKDAKCYYLESDLSAELLQVKCYSGWDLDYHFLLNNQSIAFNIQTLGLKLNTWTVNDFSVGKSLLEKGIDFLTTDEPELFI